jgi:prepilin-type N-terminal cleavage/methylation domain-containing protein
MMKTEPCRGFTLVEVLLSTVIAVLVFAAMGSLLVKGFSVWSDATAYWHLAQQSRVARARILSGGEGPGTGILSVSKIYDIDKGEDWSTVKYAVSRINNEFWLRGFVTEASQANQSLFIKDNTTGEESWAIIVGEKGSEYAMPDLSASSFDAELNGDVLTLNYVLRYRAGGRRYEQAQRIMAYLINKDNPGYYVVSTSGDDTADDDGDNGHGNSDGYDPSNPGNSDHGNYDWWDQWWDRWNNGTSQ